MISFVQKYMKETERFVSPAFSCIASCEWSGKLNLRDWKQECGFQ